MKYLIPLLLLMPVVANGQQLQSVLVTPRVQLETQVVEQQQPQVQYVQPQPQVQYQYVQPAPQQNWANAYWQYRMWFNAHYQQRGILFPRYVRRRPGDPAFDYYHIWRMSQRGY